MESTLSFANADHVPERVRALAVAGGVRAVVLDAETVPAVDVTAAQMLVELARDLARRGVTLLVAREIGEVRDMLSCAGAEDVPAPYPTVEPAVGAARAGTAEEEGSAWAL